MHWELLTTTNILLTENNDNDTYKEVPINNVQKFYLTDGNVYVGINNDLTFFINNQIIDLKLKQKINSVFQYKTASVSFITHHENIIYNIGMHTEDDKYKYKYTLIIHNGKIDVIADKYDNDVLINQRQIQLTTYEKQVI